jgi:chromosome segregation ATPase
VITLSGLKTLGSIEEALREARHDLEATNEQLAKASNAQSDLQRHEGAAYRELAGLRLDVMTRDALVQELDQSERQAMALLDDHQATVAALDRDLTATAEASESLRQDRAALVERTEPLAQQIDEAEAKTQSRLAEDPAFKAQLETAKAAETVVKRAERKAERAREDRIEKGEAYEASALFMYLWSRGYGTSRYRAFPLTRWLDGKVAKLCNYAAARPNYSLLLKLPERLGEHVEEVRAQAQAEAERLEVLEHEALEADGVTKLAASFAELEAELEALDDKISEHEDERATLQRRRAQLMGGESENSKKALEILSAAYRQDSIRTLFLDAKATSMPDDDLVVERLEGITERQRDLQRDLDHLRTMQRAQQQRVSELEEIIKEFRHRSFDRSNSVFTDPDLVTMLLAQFIKGALSSQGLWDTLRKQQRFDRRRADPGFGSGGLWRQAGRRKSAGPLGPIGGGLGRRRSGGGGFRTGGSF